MASPARLRPPLQSGDRLGRLAFHHIYRQRDDLAKAELVKGVVYLPSPAGFEEHAKPQSLINLWLGTYAARHDDLETGVEATVFLNDDSEVQPDGLLLRRGPEATAVISGEDYVEGAPELVVEIASSSAAYDLFDKKDAYRAAGVQEYVVWDTHGGVIHWFILERGEYRPAAALHGLYESTQFPGLRLDIAAALAGDRARLLAALE